jgi:DNA-binding transcriptional LysR family regulator
MHKAPTFDWDDLRVFLAVAREGSTIAAARALKVDQSTVQRRLGGLEAACGARLVERQPGGYRLSELGRALVPRAEQVEAAAQAFERQVDDARRNAVGVVRVTCPEPLVYLIRESGLLERFNARHPGVTVQFVMSDRYLDLARGEADIALRSGDVDDGVLVGRKIADSVWAVYASREYVARAGQPTGVEDLERHALIGFDEAMTQHRVAKWLQRVAPRGRVVARNTSVLGLLYAAKSGVGIAPLPTALGERDEQLVRVLGPVDELSRIWRVLAHPDARHVPRVAAFFDFVCDETEALQMILA